MSKPIRAISLWQPWAQAMATFRPDTRLPVKSVETRHWFPSVKDFGEGFPLAIHAARKPWKTKGCDADFVAAVRAHRLDASPMTYGAILCIAWVARFEPVEQLLKWRDCGSCDGTGNFYRNDEDNDFLRCDDCDKGKRPPIDSLEKLFGNYVNVGDDGEFQQRYGWTTDPSKLKILKTPIPYRGEQGIFTWNVPEGLDYK